MRRTKRHLSAGPETVRRAMVVLQRVLQEQCCLRRQKTNIGTRQMVLRAAPPQDLRHSAATGAGAGQCVKPGCMPTVLHTCRCGGLRASTAARRRLFIAASSSAKLALSSDVCFARNLVASQQWSVPINTAKPAAYGIIFLPTARQAHTSIQPLFCTFSSCASAHQASGHDQSEKRTLPTRRLACGLV